ncbi:putative gustatory receptor 28b [Planococcus citri]|uniref:putative gustatory receptor 28b n=1 Tax=Planococcus citri TaxID=170843 RepID=UPI0031F7F9B1
MDYFMIHLRERFILINTQLENSLQENDTFKYSNVIQVISNLDVYSLNKINHIHFTLYKISTQINNVYGAQFMLMIPRVIFFCVLPVHYNIVTALVRDSNDHSPQLWTHVFTLMYIVLLTSPVIYVVNVASNTVNQAKRIHVLIHDLIDEDQEEQIEYELLIFSIQLLHRHIDFSVHEFFSLKPSLTTAMIELIITYVIILLQFQDTLASISPIQLLLRPIHIVEAIFNNDLLMSTTSTYQYTDFTSLMFYNYTTSDLSE